MVSGGFFSSHEAISPKAYWKPRMDTKRHESGLKDARLSERTAVSVLLILFAKIFDHGWLNPQTPSAPHVIGVNSCPFVVPVAIASAGEV
jgi:hypothetical protein